MDYNRAKARITNPAASESIFASSAKPTDRREVAAGKSAPSFIIEILI